MRYHWSKIQYGLPSPKALLDRTSSYTRRVFLTFLLLYLFLIFFARYECFRDRTSAFFQLSKGYMHSYSAVRTAQAEQYRDCAVRSRRDILEILRPPDTLRWHCDDSKEGCAVLQEHGGLGPRRANRGRTCGYAFESLYRPYRSFAAPCICRTVGL